MGHGEEELTVIERHSASPPVEHESPAHRRAVEESGELQRLLQPFAGKWVALRHDWAKVIAADEDYHACVRMARNAANGDIPCFYRVPAA